MLLLKAIPVSVARKIRPADRLRPASGSLEGESRGKNEHDFDPRAMAEGIAVELEHTTDWRVAKRIAMDHLAEDPRYYQKLRKLEKSFGGETVAVIPELELVLCERTEQTGDVFLVKAFAQGTNPNPRERAGHKYIKRVPTGKTAPRWRYFYAIPGRGIVSSDELQVGARFKGTHEHEGETHAGHFEVTGVDHGNGTVTVQHTGSGQAQTMSHDAFGQMVNAQHQPAWQERANAKTAEVEESIRNLGGLSGKAQTAQAKRAHRLIDQAHAQGWHSPEQAAGYRAQVQQAVAPPAPQPAATEAPPTEPSVGSEHPQLVPTSRVKSPQILSQQDLQKMALTNIVGVKPGYRAKVYDNLGLGQYGPQNPHVLALAAAGLVKIGKTGIVATEQGKKAYAAMPMHERDSWSNPYRGTAQPVSSGTNTQPPPSETTIGKIPKNLRTLPPNALTQFPSGRWGFSGHVDAALHMERKDGKPITDEDIREVQQSSNPSWTMDARGLKGRTFASREEAQQAAAALGMQVTSPTPAAKIDQWRQEAGAPPITPPAEQPAAPVATPPASPPAAPAAAPTGQPPIVPPALHAKVADGMEKLVRRGLLHPNEKDLILSRLTGGGGKNAQESRVKFALMRLKDAGAISPVQLASALAAMKGEAPSAPPASTAAPVVTATQAKPDAEVLPDDLKTFSDQNLWDATQSPRDKNGKPRQVSPFAQAEFDRRMGVYGGGLSSMSHQALWDKLAAERQEGRGKGPIHDEAVKRELASRGTGGDLDKLKELARRDMLASAPVPKNESRDHLRATVDRVRSEIEASNMPAMRKKGLIDGLPTDAQIASPNRTSEDHRDMAADVEREWKEAQAHSVSNKPSEKPAASVTAATAQAKPDVAGKIDQWRAEAGAPPIAKPEAEKPSDAAKPSARPEPKVEAPAPETPERKKLGDGANAHLGDEAPGDKVYFHATNPEGNLHSPVPIKGWSTEAHGLYVNQGDGGWNVTHGHSGMRLAEGFKTKKQAEQAVAEHAAKLSWAAPAKQLLQDPAIRAAQKRLREAGETSEGEFKPWREPPRSADEKDKDRQRDSSARHTAEESVKAHGKVLEQRASEQKVESQKAEAAKIHAMLDEREQGFHAGTGTLSGRQIEDAINNAAPQQYTQGKISHEQAGELRRRHAAIDNMIGTVGDVAAHDDDRYADHAPDGWEPVSDQEYYGRDEAAAVAHNLTKETGIEHAMQMGRSLRSGYTIMRHPGRTIDDAKVTAARALGHASWKDAREALAARFGQPVSEEEWASLQAKGEALKRNTQDALLRRKTDAAEGKASKWKQQGLQTNANGEPIHENLPDGTQLPEDQHQNVGAWNGHAAYIRQPDRNGYEGDFDPATMSHHFAVQHLATAGGSRIPKDNAEDAIGRAIDRHKDEKTGKWTWQQKQYYGGGYGDRGRAGGHLDDEIEQHWVKGVANSPKDLTPGETKAYMQHVRDKHEVMDVNGKTAKEASWRAAAKATDLEQLEQDIGPDEYRHVAEAVARHADKGRDRWHDIDVSDLQNAMKHGIVARDKSGEKIKFVVSSGRTLPGEEPEKAAKTSKPKKGRDVPAPEPAAAPPAAEEKPAPASDWHTQKQATGHKPIGEQTRQGARIVAKMDHGAEKIGTLERYLKNEEGTYGTGPQASVRFDDQPGSVPLHDAKDVLELPASHPEVGEHSSLTPGRAHYGLMHRPAGYGSVPGGFQQERETHPRFRHGVVSYDKPLSPADVSSYQMTPILSRDEHAKQIADQVHAEGNTKDYLDVAKEEPKNFVEGMAHLAGESGAWSTDDHADLAGRVQKHLEAKAESETPSTPTPAERVDQWRAEAGAPPVSEPAASAPTPTAEPTGDGGASWRKDAPDSQETASIVRGRLKNLKKDLGHLGVDSIGGGYKGTGSKAGHSQHWVGAGNGAHTADVWLTPHKNGVGVKVGGIVGPGTSKNFSGAEATPDAIYGHIRDTLGQHFSEKTGKPYVAPTSSPASAPEPPASPKPGPAPEPEAPTPEPAPAPAPAPEPQPAKPEPAAPAAEPAPSEPQKPEMPKTIEAPRRFNGHVLIEPTTGRAAKVVADGGGATPHRTIRELTPEEEAASASTLENERKILQEKGPQFDAALRDYQADPIGHHKAMRDIRDSLKNMGQEHLLTPEQRKAFDAIPHPGVRRSVTDGVLRNWNASGAPKGGKAKNWMAHVEQDQSEPGGLKRTFLNSDRGRDYGDVRNLDVGHVIEFAGDTEDKHGSKTKHRKYAAIWRKVDEAEQKEQGTTKIGGVDVPVVRSSGGSHFIMSPSTTDPTEAFRHAKNGPPKSPEAPSLPKPEAPPAPAEPGPAPASTPLPAEPKAGERIKTPRGTTAIATGIPGLNASQGADGTWNIAHHHSGANIARGFATQEEALGAAQTHGKAHGIDWTAPKEQLVAHPRFAEAGAAFRGASTAAKAAAQPPAWDHPTVKGQAGVPVSVPTAMGPAQGLSTAAHGIVAAPHPANPGQHVLIHAPTGHKLVDRSWDSPQEAAAAVAQHLGGTDMTMPREALAKDQRVRQGIAALAQK